MCLLYIPILWALLFLVRGNDLDFEEEIFTRPGSDLLLPMRRHLTLNHPDTERCDEFAWTYVNSSGDWVGIAVHSDCNLYDFRHFPNTRISENGSLIISNVTLENDGRYFVIIYNSAGGHIQRDDYIVHVEGCVDTEEADIYFLIDGSGSILSEEFEEMKRFMTGVVSVFRVGPNNVRFGVVQYSDNTKIEFTINMFTAQKTLKEAIKQIRQLIGSTKTGKALQSMKSLFAQAERERARKVARSLIVITDGASHDRVTEAAADIRGGGITIYAIGVRHAIEEELEDIAGSKDKMFFVENFDSLDLIKKELTRDLCTPGNVPSVQEEIFTQPGSDLLLPIRRRLTLNHPDTVRCDGLFWFYQKSPRDWVGIAEHGKCEPSDLRYFPNTRISENGSLIISNVTLENDGIYGVNIYSIGRGLQKDFYSVHVEVPVSVPLLHVSCLRNGSAEISCRVEAGTKPNIHLSVIGGSQGNYSASANKITVIVESTGPWNITCTVENRLNQSEESIPGVTCPGEGLSGWGHFLSSGAVFVLYTGLLVFMANDLRKMENEKNEKDRRERSMRRRDQVEMEMEPTYYDDCE